MYRLVKGQEENLPPPAGCAKEIMRSSQITFGDPFVL